MDAAWEQEIVGSIPASATMLPRTAKIRRKSSTWHKHGKHCSVLMEIRALQRNVRELPPLLKLESAQAEARARIKILQAFLEAAKSEAMGQEM